MIFHDNNFEERRKYTTYVSPFVRIKILHLKMFVMLNAELFSICKPLFYAIFTAVPSISHYFAWHLGKPTLGRSCGLIQLLDREYFRPSSHVNGFARPDTLIPQDCLLTQPRYDLIDSSFSRVPIRR